MLRASGTLNALPGSGRAAASSASAARRKLSSVGRRRRAGPPRRVRPPRLVRHAAERDARRRGSTPSGRRRAPRPPTPARTRTTRGRAPCGSASGAATAAAGSSTAVISSPRCEHGVPLGVVAGQPVQLASPGSRARRPARGRTTRVERGQGHRHVGRVGRDAVLGGARGSAWSRSAADRGAARPRLPLVARRGDVLEVHAAGALQQVAAGGRELRSWPEAPASSACDSTG